MQIVSITEPKILDENEELKRFPVNDVKCNIYIFIAQNKVHSIISFTS